MSVENIHPWVEDCATGDCDDKAALARLGEVEASIQETEYCLTA